MPTTPRTLVVDLLSTVGGRAMPVRALIAAGEVFEFRPESMRVALVRLCEHGTIERNERGQYRFAAAARAVQEHVVAWNRIEDRMVPWRGGWIGVHTGALARSERGRLRRRERALQLYGFRPFESGLWLRPDNLRGGVEATRAALVDLGLEASAPVFGVSQLDAASDERARALWDTAALRASYREMSAALAESAARLPSLPARQAMAESFELGGEAIRRIVFDPLLPEPIVPAGELAGLVEVLRRYDRLGRDSWRSFMKDQGAPHPSAPLKPQSPLRQAAGGW